MKPKPEGIAYAHHTQGNRPGDWLISRAGFPIIEAAVNEAKKSREWRKEYMTLMMRDEEMVEKGLKRVARNMMHAGEPIERIVLFTGEDEDTVQEWLEEDDD